MSNGLLSRKLKATIAKNTFSVPGYVQVRYKTGRKFLIPDSLKPRPNIRTNRYAPSKGDSYNRRWRGNGPYTNDQASDGPDDQVQRQLDNLIEQGVQKTAAIELGLSTEPVLQEFFGQSHHPHISSFMKAKVDINHINDKAIRTYWQAIENFLPEDPLTKMFVTSSRGKLRHRSYTWASPHDADTDGVGSTGNRMNLGWHMFLFTNPILGKRLLFDGTDAKFVPGPPSVWRHRLWAGGSVVLHRMFAEQLPSPATVHQVERPVGLRIVGVNKTPEKVFVTVRKEFHRIEGKVHPDEYNVRGVVQALSEEPAYNKNKIQTHGPWLSETYTLCFLRNAPKLSSEGAATKVIAPPGKAKFSHTLTPDRHLLFCWSALSYNAHLIHLDSAFAQKEYGAKDLIVHGPLTLMLILEWFHREITRYAVERQLSRFHLQSIDYKNLAPLYVDEPMTLCTKPTKFQTPGTLADSWEVWVQKDMGEGVTSMAFKGTIKLRIEQDPDVKRSLQLGPKGDPSNLEPDDEAGDTSGFKSPFF